MRGSEQKNAHECKTNKKQIFENILNVNQTIFTCSEIALYNMNDVVETQRANVAIVKTAPNVSDNDTNKRETTTNEK